MRSENIKKLRTNVETQEKMREQNKKDVNNFRMKTKQKQSRF